MRPNIRISKGGNLSVKVSSYEVDIKSLSCKPSVKDKDIVLETEGGSLYYDEDGYYDEPLTYDGIIAQYVFSKPVVRIKEIKPYGN